MSKLKPCPFCGGKALIGQTFDAEWYAVCAKDHCCKIESYWRTEADAISAWNTRASDATIKAQAAEIARLRGAFLEVKRLLSYANQDAVNEVTAQVNKNKAWHKARAALKGADNATGK